MPDVAVLGLRIQRQEVADATTALNALTAAAAGAEKQALKTSSAHDQLATMFRKDVERAESSHASFQRVQRALGVLALTANNLEGPMARLVEVFGQFALGGGVAGTALAALAAWGVLMGDDKKKSEELAGSLEKLTQAYHSANTAAGQHAAQLSFAIQATAAAKKALDDYRATLPQQTTATQQAFNPLAQFFPRLLSWLGTTNQLTDEQKGHLKDLTDQYNLWLDAMRGAEKGQPKWDEINKKITEYEDHLKKVVEETDRLAKSRRDVHETKAASDLGMTLNELQGKEAGGTAKQETADALAKAAFGKDEKGTAEEMHRLATRLSNEWAKGFVEFLEGNKSITDVLHELMAKGLQTAISVGIQGGVEDALKKLKKGDYSGLEKAGLALGAGLGIGYALGGATGSPLIGAAGGAAAGAEIGGPLGAVVGGLAGLAGGLLGAADAAYKAQQAMLKLQASVNDTIRGMIDSLSGAAGALDQQIMKIQEEGRAAITQNHAYVQSLLDAGSFSGSAQQQVQQALQMEQTLNLEVSVLTYARIQALREELAARNRQAAEDYRVRELVAEGLNDQADALAFAEKQQREYAQAVRDGADATTLAALAAAQHAEALRHQADVIQSQLQTANAALAQTAQLVTSLRGYSAQLRGSIASPGDSLAILKQQFDDMAAKAKAGDANAATQLVGLGQTFLQASRAYNASGAGFVADTQYVQAIVDALAAQYGDQMDVQQRQVDLLQKQYDALMAILNALTGGGDQGGGGGGGGGDQGGGGNQGGGGGGGGSGGGSGGGGSGGGGDQPEQPQVDAVRVLALQVQRNTAAVQQAVSLLAATVAKQ